MVIQIADLDLNEEGIMLLSETAEDKMKIVMILSLADGLSLLPSVIKTVQVRSQRQLTLNGAHKRTVEIATAVYR